MGQSNSTPLEIKTLVFFHLVTSSQLHHGVLQDPSAVQMTELSMVAIDRHQFAMSSYPDLREIRVVNKLTLCVKPGCEISQEMAEATGLNKSNLMFQKHFDESAARSICNFLDHLPDPVCLLAFEGKELHFPLLQAEYKRLFLTIPRNIHIVDIQQVIRHQPIAGIVHQKLSLMGRSKVAFTSLTLQELHEALFGKPDVISSAEVACFTLAKICHTIKDPLFEWINENSTELSTIEAMW